MNELNMGQLPVRSVNGGPAARGWKTAQNKDKQTRRDISTAKKTALHPMGKGLFEIHFHGKVSH